MSVRLDDVSKHYREHDALLNVDVSIPAGGAYFVTGPSGAGKSTLLRLMALLEQPSHGRVFVEDEDAREMSRRDLLHLRSEMSFVFQQPYLLHDRNVFDNVALPLLIKGCSNAEIVRRTNAVLQSVRLLHRAREYPATFSAGEQEKLGIARALVSRPRILFADEPTGNLDPGLSSDVMRLLCTMPVRGATAVIATHDVFLLEQFSHVPVLELENGRVKRDGIAEKMTLEDGMSDAATLG